MKEKTHSKQSGLSKTEKGIDRGRKSTGVRRYSKKDKRCIILFNKFVFVRDSPPKYDKVNPLQVGSGPSGILGSDGKLNTTYVGARGVRIVALSFSSHKQIQ